jgi:hypothetical protein
MKECDSDVDYLSAANALSAANDLAQQTQGDIASAHEVNQYLDQQPGKTGMMTRSTNLENIFVELTGRNLD